MSLLWIIWCILPVWKVHYLKELSTALCWSDARLITPQQFYRFEKWKKKIKVTALSCHLHKGYCMTFKLTARGISKTTAGWWDMVPERFLLVAAICMIMVVVYVQLFGSHDTGLKPDLIKDISFRWLAGRCSPTHFIMKLSCWACASAKTNITDFFVPSQRNGTQGILNRNI